MANEESDAEATRRLAIVRQMLSSESIGDLLLAAINLGYSLEILTSAVSVSKWDQRDYRMHYHKARLCTPETRTEILKSLLVDALWEVYKEG